VSPLNDPIPTDPQDAIERLVRGPAVSVGENVTLRSVAAVLSAADIGAALVRSDAGRIRMISERDIARALAEDVDPDQVWSADVASGGLVTVDVRDRILQVAFRMLEEDIRHIAIERDGEVIGVVSSRAVFAVLAEHALEMF
jgi:signal-transduction protein with cAMP-binding, CBS, and nucleotidyltransferase domain